MQKVCVGLLVGVTMIAPIMNAILLLKYATKPARVLVLSVAALTQMPTALGTRAIHAMPHSTNWIAMVMGNAMNARYRRVFLIYVHRLWIATQRI